MSPLRRPHTLAEQYDQTLHLTRDWKLPAGYPKPAPTSCWPKENIVLYERYRDWLLSGGASEEPTKTIYLPVAGHVLALNLKPHSQINLEDDLERVMDYTRAKQSGKDWIKATHNGLEKFRCFLRIERGLGKPIKTQPFDISRYTAGLPAWLVSELERYQRLQQRNWRAARIDSSLRSFWGKNLRIWRFLVEQRGVKQLSDLKRQHVIDYVDQRLDAGYTVNGVNGDLRYLRGFLLILQDEGYAVPQVLLRIPGLKPPDSLPKYLTDEQMRSLRNEIKHRVHIANLPSHRRDAQLVRAAFYLLWQGGLRLGEVEELRLEDLDFPGKRLAVRNGKGLKDRTIYLNGTMIEAMQAYLVVRGQGTDDHLFLYRNLPLNKDLIHIRLKAAGQRWACMSILTDCATPAPRSCSTRAAGSRRYRPSWATKISTPP
jgi:site-specific recombinase XerD